METGWLAQLEFEWQKQSSKVFIVRFNYAKCQEGVSLKARVGQISSEDQSYLALVGSISSWAQGKSDWGDSWRLTWDIGILAGMQIVLDLSLGLICY